MEPGGGREGEKWGPKLPGRASIVLAARDEQGFHFLLKRRGVRARSALLALGCPRYTGTFSCSLRLSPKQAGWGLLCQRHPPSGWLLGPFPPTYEEEPSSPSGWDCGFCDACSPMPGPAASAPGSPSSKPGFWTHTKGVCLHTQLLQSCRLSAGFKATDLTLFRVSLGERT